MRWRIHRSNRTRRTLAAIAVASVTVMFASAPASAHFTLDTPPAYRTQDALGGPQKLGPCGDEAGGEPSGLVAAYATGQTISITIDEKIFHPGHYRVALAVDDKGELPAEPIVTPGSSPCGSVEIQNPPVYPVLADGMLPHTSAFSGPQTFEVTLPAGVTCDHCVLQVIEFMSNHPLNDPGGCFYHHCADISIGVGTPTSSVAAVSGTDDGATGSTSGGCSFAAPRSRGTLAGSVVTCGFLALAFAARRRASRKAVFPRHGERLR